MNVQLNEILTPELLTEYAQHIRDFLLLEGIKPAPELGETLLSERLIKELIEELAG